MSAPCGSGRITEAHVDDATGLHLTIAMDGESYAGLFIPIGLHGATIKTLRRVAPDLIGATGAVHEGAPLIACASLGEHRRAP